MRLLTRALAPHEMATMFSSCALLARAKSPAAHDRARTGSLCYAGMSQWHNTFALSTTHMHYVATAVTLQDMLRGRSCCKWQNFSTHNSGHVGLMTFTLQELLRCKICFVTGAITNSTALSLTVVTTLT